MAGEFDHDLGGDVISGGLREIVDDDGQRRAVGYGAIESQQVRRVHLLFIIVWSSHHGGVIAQFGGVFGEAQSFTGGLDAGACDHHFIGRGGGQSRFEHVAAFLIREQNRFSRRTLDYDARDRRARIALNVGFDFLVIHFAVGIEGRGNGWEDSG